jgi:hypothetical protein
MTVLAVVSYGGGKQSTALLVLAAQGKMPIRTFLFANVGDDSEDPRTIAYVRHVAQPYAAVYGIELHELDRIKRGGIHQTLYGQLTNPDSRSIPIPIRMADTGAPGTRNCTDTYKIKVIGKWLEAHGASEESPAVVAVGISVDELHRVNTRKARPHERLAYPLLGLLDGRFDAAAFEQIDTPMSRLECDELVRAQLLPPQLVPELQEHFTEFAPDTQADLLASGFSLLPRPGKSACYFCPFKKPSEWALQRKQSPELFQQAAELEELLNRRREMLGRDRAYLTRYGKPLAEAIPEVIENADDLDDGHCDNGYCMT